MKQMILAAGKVGMLMVRSGCATSAVKKVDVNKGQVTTTASAASAPTRKATGEDRKVVPRPTYLTAGTSPHPVVLAADFSLCRIRQLRAPPPDCGCSEPDIEDHVAPGMLSTGDDG